jgi:lipopolysaccharide export LptBFGC system permease protein LptF
MKLRLSIILPAMILGILLAVLAIVFPDPLRPLMAALPVLAIIAAGLVLFIERQRRHSKVD